MLDTLDARLAQARAGADLGHLEFLEVLCEGEIARRAAKSLGERVRRARFEERVTLEEFDFSFTPKVPAALIRDLAALRFVAGGHSVILYEPVGVGKTHVAQALGHAACRRGHSVLFAKRARVVAEPDGGTELPAEQTAKALVGEWSLIWDLTRPWVHRWVARAPAGGSTWRERRPTCSPSRAR